jgi:hypothetical protein
MKKTLIIILVILTLYSCEKEYNDISNDKSTEISSPSLKAVKVINGDAIVPGHYYWRLLFNYDNTGNTQAINYKMTIAITKTFTTKNFVKETFSLTSGWKYNSTSSVNLKYKDIVGGSSSSSYEYHTEMARTLEESYEATASTSTTTTYEANFSVGAGCKLSAYQLIFTSSFGTYATPTVVTNPEAVSDITMEFGFTEEIMGLEGMLDDVLLHTIPGSQNRVEWEAIRNNIIANSIYDDHTRLYELIKLLSTITPGKANKAEWKAIQGICNSILNNWNTENRNKLFRQLLQQFSITKPGKDNKAEWKRISDKADYILVNTTQIW